MVNESLASQLPSASPARLIGVFESGSPEWLAARATGIGGSEVGVICGLNKWESPLSLWAKKLKLIDDTREPSEAMYWGTTLESVVMAEFIKRHPELEVWESPGTYHHVDRPWQVANPDGIARHRETGEWSVVEIKTARYEDEWNEETGDVPPSYRAQVLWYLQTFGLKKAHVATLFSGSKYREFQQTADDFEMDANLERVILWRSYLENGTQPDYDGSESTYNAIREMHPDIDPDLPDVELDEAGRIYLKALSQFEDAQSFFNRAKSEVLDVMGKAKRGTLAGNVIVTRQARGATGLPYLLNKKQ